MKKYILFAMIVISIMVLGCKQNEVLGQDKTHWINSFEDCIAAGFPAMESYPRQCRVGDKTFVEEIDEPLIGGQRDGHGCLGPGGYTWNENASACIRDWELNEAQIKAAKIAVEHVGYEKGLTIVGVDVFRCPGCFDVHVDNGSARVIVSLLGWNVTKVEKTTIDITQQ